jgi:hypothetical protein
MRAPGADRRSCLSFLLKFARETSRLSPSSSRKRSRNAGLERSPVQELSYHSFMREPARKACRLPAQPVMSTSGAYAIVKKISHPGGAAVQPKAIGLRSQPSASRLGNASPYPKRHRPATMVLTQTFSTTLDIHFTPPEARGSRPSRLLTVMHHSQRRSSAP